MGKRRKTRRVRRHGPRSFRDQAVAPVGCHVDMRIQLRKNRKRSLKSLAADRYGFKLMWRVAPGEMRNAGVQPWGTYDKKNSHKGRIWGWKSECPLTEEKVKRIAFKVLEVNVLTLPQLEMVRKALSYAWQLCNGVQTHVPQKQRNWIAVKSLWSTVKVVEIPATGKSTKPDKIPTPQELGAAFKKQWHSGHPMSRVEFSMGVISAYDTYVFGTRSNEDMKRIKKSKEHALNVREGFNSVGYVGGRCKLAEGYRPWSLYGVCMCVGGKHISPGQWDKDAINLLGNPHPLPFEWCSTCPVACDQFIKSFPGVNGRRYPKPNKAGNGFTSYNVADPVDMANDWLIAQGVTSVPYDHNAGRKSLARLLSANNICYEHGFEVHGDEYVTWQKSYQPDCRFGDRKQFQRRTQHENADVACYALRKIANGWGLGVMKEPPPMTRQEKFLHALLMSSNPLMAEAIRMGEQSKPTSGPPPRPENMLKGPVPTIPELLN